MAAYSRQTVRLVRPKVVELWFEMNAKLKNEKSIFEVSQKEGNGDLQNAKLFFVRAISFQPWDSNPWTTELFRSRLYRPKQKVVVFILNPKKLCNTCMAKFHSCLTVGPIQLFISFLYPYWLSSIQLAHIFLQVTLFHFSCLSWPWYTGKMNTVWSIFTHLDVYAGSRINHPTSSQPIISSLANLNFLVQSVSSSQISKRLWRVQIIEIVV